MGYASSCMILKNLKNETPKQKQQQQQTHGKPDN